MSNDRIIKFLAAGSVDDGKSTLIGKILFETGFIYKDQIENVKKINNNEIDYSLFVEGLESERRQKITIDVAYRYFSYKKTKFIIADCPGHEQYTKNMAVAASNSDIALIVVDAKEGIKTQTIRHTYISYLFGIRNFVLLVNKMDLVNYDQDIFNQVRTQFLKKISSLNLENCYFIPVSSINGDNLVNRSPKMSWFQGKSLLDYLTTGNFLYQKNNHNILRIPIQNVIKHNNKRFYQGRIAQGTIKKGEEICINSHQSAIVKDIMHMNKEVNVAYDSESVSIVLSKDIDVDRGDLISKKESKPYYNNKFKGYIIWFSKDEFNLSYSKENLIKINHNLTNARITNINYLINIDDLSQYQYRYIRQNQIANVLIELKDNKPFDLFLDNKYTGSFLLIDKDNHETIACGLITENIEKNKEEITNSSEFIEELSHLIKRFFGEEKLALFMDNLKNR